MENELDNEIRLGLACLSNKFRMSIFQRINSEGKMKYSDIKEYNTKNKTKLYNHTYYLIKRNILKSSYDENGDMYIEINKDFIDRMIEYIKQG